MNVMAHFVLPLYVFLSTAWGNQYQQFYQGHFEKPYQQQHYFDSQPESEPQSQPQAQPGSQPESQPQPQTQPQLDSQPQSQKQLQPQPLSQPESQSQYFAQSQLQQSWSPLTSLPPAGPGGGPNNPPVYSSVQWGSKLHNEPHQHGTHLHGPHQHHPAHGSRVRPEDEDVFLRPYCEVRAGGGGQCCPGRQDSCHVPILDTVCYCDVFCNRTVADCCPDFWTWCMGIAPPSGAMGHGHLPLTKKKAIVSKYHKPFSKCCLQVKLLANSLPLKFFL